jgi:hypothetical protein
MSRTRRNANQFKATHPPDFVTDVQRGHVDLDLRDETGDVVLGPKGKRHLKDQKHRKDRRAAKRSFIDS